MTGGLSFHLLGPLEVRRPDGAAVELGGPQSRTTLARLLVADGHLVTAAEIVDVIWGEDPPGSALGTLQSYVSRLRRALGPAGAGQLRYEAPGYRLAVDAEQVDANRFARLSRRGGELLHAGDHDGAAAVLGEAIGLWRGPVLGDTDAEFARHAAARLDEMRLGALEDLFDARLRAGRAGAVVPDLAAAVEDSPLRERLRGLLALGLYRSGRQADALSVLETGRRLLGDELGLDLSRELRDLQTRILQQDPGLGAHDTGPPAAAPGTGGHASSQTGSTRTVERPAAPAGEPPDRPDASPLIGRAAEVRTLRAVLGEALDGPGCRYVVIEGQPGIGKTSLAQELLRLARERGALTLTAATLEIGAAPAYGPWLQLVRAAEHAGAPLPPAMDRFLAGPDPALLGTSPAAVAAALADAVAEAAAGLARGRGLVVVLEDLQWADPASLDLFAGLGPRLGPVPVVLAATVRDLEVGRDGAVVDALARIAREPGSRRLTLQGLSRSESGRLLGRAVGGTVADDVVAAVHTRSEGNPFFTTELARMLGEQGTLDAASVRAASVPTGVRDVLHHRLARLPQATRALMEAAAVLGREADLELLTSMTGGAPDTCLDDLEPALLVRLLEMPPTAPGSVRFAHALVREALVDGMSPLRRARLHLRAADGILATAGQTDDTAEILAEHLWHAAAVGGSARAATALEAAAQVALKRQALLSAESLLTRAAGLHRGAGTEEGLAELRVLRQMGFVGAALHGYAVNADSELVRRARDLARSTDRLDILLDMIWADWAGCDTGGRPWRGERLLQEAERLVEGVDDLALQAGVASMRAFGERHFGRMTSAVEHIERALDGFARCREAHEAGFYLNGSITSVGYRHWARALTSGLDRRALEDDYSAQDLPYGRMVISLFGAASTLSLGDDDGLRVYAARMIEADPDMLLSFWSAAAEMYSAVSLLQRGLVAEGLELFARGRDHMEQAGARTMLAGLYAGAAQALADAGEQAGAAEMLATARAEFDETAEIAYQPVVEIAAAHLAAASGDAAGADRALDRAAEIALEHGSHGLVARVDRERDAITPR